MWDFAALLASGHLQARGMLQRGQHAVLGDVPLVPQPVKFDAGGAGAAPAAPAAPAAATRVPTLGEDTDAVLAELLGLDAERLAALHARGVL